MKRITGAHYIAELVKAYGISHVFFVPAILSTALVEMESLGIRRIVTHSEKAAVYMADGYARIHGGPALCMAQSVGAANLAAGLQDPYLAHSPVIAITGRKPARARHRNAYQEIEHRRLFDSVTKYNVEVDEVEQLPHLFPQAFREAVSAVPGPVHLELVGYEGDAICRAEADLDLVIEEEYSRFPPFRPPPPEEPLREALGKIQTTRRPIIVAGRGVIMSHHRQRQELFSLREKSLRLLDQSNPVHDEHGASRISRLVAESPSVGQGDSATNRQAQPAAVGASGEIGREQLVTMLGRHSHTIVLDDDADIAVLLGLDVHLQMTTFFQRLHAVEEKIEEQLAQHLGVRPYYSTVTP